MKKFIITFLFVVSVLFVNNVNALTITESTDPTDGLTTIEDNSIVIGITRFEDGVVITAQRAATAGVNDALFNIDLEGYSGVNIYYYLAGSWFVIDTDNQAQPLDETEDEELIEELNNPEIYYVNNEEKKLTVDFTYDGIGDLEFDTDNNKEGSVKYENGKLTVPATVKKLEIKIKDPDTGDVLGLIVLTKDEENNTEYDPVSLTSYINALKKVSQADYTVTSWDAYQIVVLANVVTEENTQAQIDTATSNILDAQDDLVFAGQADLDAAIADAEGLTEADYTVASWTVLETALALPETTNALVVEKTNAIDMAISMLVFAGQADLDTALEREAALISTNYVDYSAVTEALAKPETTNALIIVKTNAINAAIDGLVLKAIVERDPANTGGIGSTFTDETNTFGGTIAYYPYADGFPPTSGNYVGVKVTAPEGVIVDRTNATFTYTNQAGTLTTLTSTWLEDEGDYVFYYPKVTEVPQTFTFVIDWDGSGTVYVEETITINIATGTTLETAKHTVSFAVATNSQLVDITTATNYVATATAIDGVAYIAPILAAEGFVFDGWYTDEAGTVKYVKSTTAITSDITLYAKFIEASFEHEAANGTKTYFTTIADAFNKGSGTITMLKDSTVSSRYTITNGIGQPVKNIILDLGGKTLTNTVSDSTYRAILIQKGNSLTVKNGTINFTAGDGFYLNSGHLTLESDVTINANNNTAVFLVNGSTLTTEADINSGNDFAIAGNGGTGYGNTTVNVNGGTITSDVIAIYQPQSGALNISGGIITGSTAVYAKSGTTTISGGTMNGNGTASSYTYDGNGAVATGDALVIDNCNYPGGVPNVSITGGVFNSTNAAPVGSYAYGELSPITGFITGGTFSSNPTLYVASGYVSNESGGVWIVTAQ